MNQKIENFLSFFSSSSQTTNNNTFNINPTIILTITVISIIVVISALLHLLIRFLLKPRSPLNHTSQEISTVFQGRLQTLFNLHDSGVDQSFIDTLPMFHYKTIIGLKQDPFDCSVCLCHFEAEDELRLLPNCSHAFHVACIDTWLLTNSTCPLCRDNLLDSFTPSSSPVVLVLESDGESSQELKSSEIISQNDESKQEIDERVVLVKLGKFKNIDSSKEESHNNGETRRCFSMGYIEYVMPEDTLLQAPITVKKKKKKKQSLSSLCIAGDSRKDFTFIKDINYDRKEGFSMSKTWLIDGLDEGNGLAGRRAVSFRVPVKLSGSGDVETEENDGFPASLDTKSVSFTRRNMFWPWRQEKVSNSSSFVNNNINNV